MTTSLADLPLLSRLLDDALGLPPDQAESWLAALPPEHAHLRTQLHEMLSLHRSQAHASFLASGPHLAGELAGDGTGAGAVARPGDLVGPYRLIREIGHGGMGAVWLADRADGVLKREVALKLPRLSSGARLAERMARERDIGALLAHPNIARLYDAGIDAGGRPYLALEHVDGEPVDAWCARLGLDVPQRLRLFLQIARAVAYAHGRLVVHRDLKPSNVLVTADGQAHLLDFGIATLLHDSVSADADTPPADERERMLTPHYASPEQLRGEAITVGSDVYSLGVLLFELLTGRLPHEPVRQSLAELERAVLDDEAPLASTRASDHRTVRALRGELDAIIAKALQRRPEDRYATADAMAQDIERHLAGERVLAHPDSLRYRLVKSLRRHRVGFAAAGAVLVAVLGATVVSLLQAQRASDAAERARVVKEFVIDVFKVNEHGERTHAALRQLPAELLLERSAMLIDSRFKSQPLLQTELYGVVGGIFAGMGANESAARYATRQLEGQAARGASASEQAQATLLLAQALLAQGRIAPAQSMAQTALALAGHDPVLRPRILLLLAHLLLQQGHEDEGLRALDDAERALQAAGASTIDAARAKVLRASLLIGANRIDEARPLYQAAIDLALAAEGALSPAAIDIRLVIASNLALQDRDADARPLREAALAALREGGGAGAVRAALVESDTATTLFTLRKIGFDEAHAALERDRALLGAHGALVPARAVATIDFDLARTYLEWGDLQRADALLSASVATLMPQADSLRDRYLYAELQGIAAMLAGRHDAADGFFGDELEIQRQLGAERHPDRVFDQARRALNRSMQGRFDEAEALLASVPALAPAHGGNAPALAGYREVAARALARVKLDRGDAAAALALLPALPLGGDAAATSDDGAATPLDPLLLRGEILCALARPADGLALLERALARKRERDYEHSPPLARTQAVAGACALAAGQPQRAAELAALARTSLQDQPDAGPYFRQPAQRLDALLSARGRGG